MQKLLIAAALVLAPATHAIAHDHDWPLDTDLSIEQALEMAYANGITIVRDIEFDDGVWEIEGRNADGVRIELDIDGATGQIIAPR